MTAISSSPSISTTSSRLQLRPTPKTLKGLTPYEFVCKAWTSQPERFTLNPLHQMPGLNSALRAQGPRGGDQDRHDRGCHGDPIGQPGRCRRRWSGHRSRRAIHGYKAHVGADADTALVEEVAITPGNVHDGRAGGDASPDNPGEVYADSAYRGEAFRSAVRARGGVPRVALTAMWVCSATIRSAS